MTWKGHRLPVSLLIPADREQEEEEKEKGGGGGGVYVGVQTGSLEPESQQFRSLLAGENCVQYGWSQTGESAMSWGTELWVCLNSLNSLFPIMRSACLSRGQHADFWEMDWKRGAVLPF